jgi:hypothetical protein
LTIYRLAEAWFRVYSGGRIMSRKEERMDDVYRGAEKN